MSNNDLLLKPSVFQGVTLLDFYAAQIAGAYATNGWVPDWFKPTIDMEEPKKPLTYPSAIALSKHKDIITKYYDQEDYVWDVPRIKQDQVEIPEEAIQGMADLKSKWDTYLATRPIYQKKYDVARIAQWPLFYAKSILEHRQAFLQQLEPGADIDRKNSIDALMNVPPRPNERVYTHVFESDSLFPIITNRISFLDNLGNICGQSIYFNSNKHIVDHTELRNILRSYNTPATTWFAAANTLSYKGDIPYMILHLTDTIQLKFNHD